MGLAVKGELFGVFVPHVAAGQDFGRPGEGYGVDTAVDVNGGENGAAGNHGINIWGHAGVDPLFRIDTAFGDGAVEGFGEFGIGLDGFLEIGFGGEDAAGASAGSRGRRRCGCCSGVLAASASSVSTSACGRSRVGVGQILLLDREQSESGVGKEVDGAPDSDNRAAVGHPGFEALRAG